MGGERCFAKCNNSIKSLNAVWCKSFNQRRMALNLTYTQFYKHYAMKKRWGDTMGGTHLIYIIVHKKRQILIIKSISRTNIRNIFSFLIYFLVRLAAIFIFLNIPLYIILMVISDIFKTVYKDYYGFYIPICENMYPFQLFE